MALTTGTPKRRLGEEHSPLHDRVVAELRQAILSGRLKPGERLIEGHLADELEVPAIPCARPFARLPPKACSK